MTYTWHCEKKKEKGKCTIELATCLVMMEATCCCPVVHACDDGWEMGAYAELCYRLLMIRLTQPQASTACQQLGGELAEVYDEHVQHLVYRTRGYSRYARHRC